MSWELFSKFGSYRSVILFPPIFCKVNDNGDTIKMGRLRRSRTHKAQRDTHRASRTRARTKDLDQIQQIDMDPKVCRLRFPCETRLTVVLIQNRVKLEAQPLDLEKPGLAQHYCVECAKYVSPSLSLYDRPNPNAPPLQVL